MISFNKNNPLVSVIIPLYNQKQYIKRAIDSVLHQTYSPIEIIVVNDGSIDNPLEILNSYEDKIKIINQSNKGLAAARNTGFEHASGKYIQFLDSDDTILKEKIKRQVNILEKNGGIDLTACRTIWVDEKGKILSVQKKYSKKFPTIRDFLMENQFPVHSALMKKEVFQKTGLFDKDMNPIEDWDMWIRILLQGYKVSCTNHVLVKYFQINDSMSSNDTIMFNMRIKILNKYFMHHNFSEVFKKHAVGNAYLQYSYQMYRNKKTKDARKLILEAIKLNPLILNNFYFFHNFNQLYKPINLNRKYTLNEILSSQEELLTVLEQVKKMKSHFIEQVLPKGYSHYYFSIALRYLSRGNFQKYLLFSKYSLKNKLSYFTYMVEIIFERLMEKIKWVVNTGENQ